MPPAPRPQWQQATALITIGAGSIATGLSFVPKAPADLTSPASIPPVALLALEHTNAHAPGRDAMLRAAIVHMARHFLRLAQTRSPAEMEAMIWQYASTDGANHGPSCAAFASLTLELGSHIAGLDSWVTGGTSYPWPVHSWVDGRVDPNAASPGVVSIVQDARSHGRWHPLGDGYTPQAGDWVLFDGHVEVVTKYHGGVLHTIGGDSLPNMSVNAHEYADPLAQQGVAGFVDNGAGMSIAPAGAHGGDSGKHGEQATAAPGGAAYAAPPSSVDPSPSAAPASSARRSSGGAQAGGTSSGGTSSGSASASGARTGGASSTGPAASARPARTADAMAPQPELAPRAISAPRTVPRSRYAQESRALPAQGAGPAARAQQAPAARAKAHAAPAAPTRQRPDANGTGQPAARAGLEARPASQRRPGVGTPHAEPSQHQPGLGAQHAEPSQHHPGAGAQHADRDRAVTADVPATGLRPARPHHARPGEAAIPGLFKRAHRHHPSDASVLPPYHRHDVPPTAGPMPGTAAQQAFIKAVATGAMATQRRYGVPASVTIAQAIDESGWGQSVLAANDHNLFGIKGTGPAGSDVQPTQEVINGQVVNLSASFQIYHDIAQSIDAHGRLLARSGDYASAMAQSNDPNAFAAALTGVYATDPSYGAKLIQLMKQYDLYRFDRAASPGEAASTASAGGVQAAHHGSGAARQPEAAHHGSRAARRAEAARPGGDQHPAHRSLPHASPGPHEPSPGRNRRPQSPQPGPVGNPVPVQPAPIAMAAPGRSSQVGNPVPVEPASPPAAHDMAAPDAGPSVQSAKADAGMNARRANPPAADQAADRSHMIRHETAAQPDATLYPGRSARPAPLAHPARPADLARRSGSTTSQAPGAPSAATGGQPTGRGPGPAPSASHPGAQAGNGQPTAHASPGSGTGPGAGTGPNSNGPGSTTVPGSAVGWGSGTGAGQGAGPGSGNASGLANVSADAAIPGVPHAAVSQQGREHPRRPIGRLRPAHPAGRAGYPAPRASLAGSTTPDSAPGVNAQVQQATGPAAEPHRGTPRSASVRRPVPAAEALTGGQAESAIIPGLPHPARGTHTGAPSPEGAPANPARAATATAPPGDSSIPGTQQSAAPGYGTEAAPASATAADPARAATATALPGDSSIPGTQQSAAPGNRAGTAPASASAAVPGASAAVPGEAAAASGHPARASGHPPTAPGHSPSSGTGRAGMGASQPAAAATARAGARTRPASSVSAQRSASGRAAVATGPAAPAAPPARAPGHGLASGGRPAASAGIEPPSIARHRTAPRPGQAPGAVLPSTSHPVPASAGPAPGSASPARAAANPMPAAAGAPARGGADVPGLVHRAPATAPAVRAGATASAGGGSPARAHGGPSVTGQAGAAGQTGAAGHAGGTSPAASWSSARSPAPRASAGATLTVYRAHMPPSVREAFVTSAKMPLLRAEPLYRDVASHTGIRWEILAACDWMQCKARHAYSPVYGEKLGTVNLDDTCYRTKSAALAQCASDLVQLARSVYQLDIATDQEMTIRDLANVFAAFRWGGLLRQHNTSAMDFPYSVAGLTADHTHMRWPNIDDANAPDKPGSRFRQPFGAVPVVLGLNYQALM